MKKERDGAKRKQEGEENKTCVPRGRYDEGQTEVGDASCPHKGGEKDSETPPDNDTCRESPKRNQSDDTKNKMQKKNNIWLAAVCSPVKSLLPLKTHLSPAPPPPPPPPPRSCCGTSFWDTKPAPSKNAIPPVMRPTCAAFVVGRVRNKRLFLTVSGTPFSVFKPYIHDSGCRWDAVP